MTQRSRGILAAPRLLCSRAVVYSPIAKEHWTICTIAASARAPHRCLDWVSRLVALLPTRQHNGQHDITKRAQRSLDLAGLGILREESHVDSTTRSPATSEPLPPHATAAEQSLLGAAILEPSEVVPIASALIEPRDFYHPQNALIWTALCSFDGETAPDFSRVCDRLEQQGNLVKIGGIPYLTRLLPIGYAAHHIHEYCREIYNASFRRQLISASGRVAGIAFGTKGEPSDVINLVLEEFERVRARFAVDRRLRPGAPPPTWKRQDR